jgi:hypothetical protein
MCPLHFNGLPLRENPLVARTRDCIQNDGGVVDKGMDTAQHDAARWWTRWRLGSHWSQAEAQVARWKAAWLRGANAMWQDQNNATNPYDSEMQRAAWNAGAKWAGENPNRRTNRAGRFAHPQRRASDGKLPYVLKRAVAVSATTLTLYAISRTLWRTKETREDAS